MKLVGNVEMKYRNEQLNNFIAMKTDTLNTAMSKIEINSNRTIIIVQNSKIYGVLTDGDIRKALLNGRSLNTICEVVMNRNFTVATTKEEACAILERKLEFNVIPICDTENSLTLSAVYTRF